MKGKIIILIFIIMLFCGCIQQTYNDLSKDEKMIVGSWKGNQNNPYNMIKFSEDGSGYIISYSGKKDIKWNIENKILFIKLVILKFHIIICMIL